MIEKKLTAINIFPSQEEYEKQKENLGDNELSMIPVNAESLKGSDGKDGAQGEQGEKGADGKSAYEIAVEQGFEGTEAAWLASLVGAKGDKGDTGATGSPFAITPLVSNDDLNNYSETGFYVCTKYATAQTLKNLPSGFKTAFFMLILKNELNLQMIWHYQGSEFYIRSNDFYDGADHWSAWYKYSGTKLS